MDKGKKKNWVFHESGIDGIIYVGKGDTEKEARDDLGQEFEDMDLICEGTRIIMTMEERGKMMMKRATEKERAKKKKKGGASR